MQLEPTSSRENQRNRNWRRSRMLNETLPKISPSTLKLSSNFYAGPTSVRGATFLPQTAASASLSFFGAKMPFPAFFMANAFFFDALLMLVLPMRFFSAVIFLSVA